jgi:hypothetical protein
MSVLAKIFRRCVHPPLDLAHPQTIALSKRLRALRAMPIQTKEERDAWDAEARRLEETLHVEYASIYNSLPHEITHYLVDVDIRAKDAGYAKYQEDLLEDLLREPKEEANQSPQRNAGSPPSLNDSSASETPSSLGPRG